MQKRPAKTLDLIFFVLNFFGFFYLRNLREMIQCDEDVSEWDWNHQLDLHSGKLT